MNNKLTTYKEILYNFDMSEISSNIDMYYELSYELATYIFDYRIKNKLSQKALAKKLGIKQPMVSKLESGSYNITLENLCNVMAKLNTQIELNFTLKTELTSNFLNDSINLKRHDTSPSESFNKLECAS